MAAKAPTKSEVYKSISTTTKLSRKQVASVFDALGAVVKKSVAKKGPGLFTVPGLLKIKVVSKPPVPAGERMNPFTKQMQMFAAKPARRVVKVRPLKALKEMAA